MPLLVVLVLLNIAALLPDGVAVVVTVVFLAAGTGPGTGVVEVERDCVVCELTETEFDLGLSTSEP